MSEKMSFEEAKRNYVQRFTMEHIPKWAKNKLPNGRYHAPQYKSDREWYENTKLPPDPACVNDFCFSENHSWPLGKWLDSPYTIK